MRRGVEAVFQLLIGVFAATLVVTVAYHVLNSVQMNRCHEKWQTSTVQLANALADAARSSGATNFVQLVGKCGRANEVVYYLHERTGEQICNRICHKPVKTCYDVVFEAYGNVKGEKTLLDKGFYCADISPFTYYQLSASKDKPCSASDDVTYTNVTAKLLQLSPSDGNLVVTYPFVNVYVRSEGYGETKRVYVCMQGGP